MFDIKRTIKAKCVAENSGGTAETDFTIFVVGKYKSESVKTSCIRLGPGNAPENIALSANKPRKIHVSWDPPTIPNGIIQRYIVYYTPLDDQVTQSNLRLTQH